MRKIFVVEDDENVFVDGKEEDFFIDDDDDLGRDADFGEEEELIDRESMWITEASFNKPPEKPDITAKEFEERHARNHYNEYMSTCKCKALCNNTTQEEFGLPFGRMKQ